MAPRISIIIPTLNAARELPPTLDALLPGVALGIIREVIVVDGGSEDDTRQIAEAAGAEVRVTAPGRGGQLQTGSIAAKADWMLFLHADTHLGADWAPAVAHHIQTRDTAAVFRLAFRAEGVPARIVAGWANLRTRLMRLPYGDQGLLISRALFDQVGGYPDQPLMEDVAMARALAGRFVLLSEVAETGAEKYLAQGWVRRGARNLLTLLRYLCGADPEALANSYQKR